MSQLLIKHKDKYFASCSKGLETVLLEEVNKFKLNEPKAVSGGVSFECSAARALNFLMRTRIASRVYKKLYSFDAKKEKDIYFETKNIKWKSVFNLDQTFKIKTILCHSPNGTKRSVFTNSIYLSQQLKDAIVDRFREDTNERPNVSTVDSDVTFMVFIEPYDNQHSTKEAVHIYLDLCGQVLSNRSYRDASFEAPLRENVAAAIVDMMEFKEDDCFMDAMCGSGTVVIEKMLKDYRIPPTYLNVEKFRQGHKPWTFLNLNLFTKDEYLQKDFLHIVEKIEKETEQGLSKMLKSPIKIWARDLNNAHLQFARTNFERAKLFKGINIEKADATVAQMPGNFNGIVFTNPPYGERLQPEGLAELYHDLGENMKKNFTGQRWFILTGNMQMLKSISLKTSKRIPIFNGDIECRLAEYRLF